MVNRKINILILVSIYFMLASCSKKNFTQLPDYHFKSADGKPHYNDLHYWAAHPWKWDPSDSVPEPLKESYYQDSSVDVFFIHPTTFTDYKNEKWNANIDDTALNAKTDYSTILYQASAFNKGARIFAPRYRQAHIRAFFSDNIMKNGLALNFAYKDVKEAFEYYLAHFNNGRPVIIASHSQGTIHAGSLLKEFFDAKTLQPKLICAYVIGMPIPENYFTSLKPCRDSLGTGCVVGWRAYQTGYIDTNYIGKEKFKSWVTNPLSWTMDTMYVPKTFNKSAVLNKFNKLTPGIVDAQIHGNVLWCNKPKFFGSIFIKQKNFHIGDINLYYVNIRDNMQTRIKMFWKNNTIINHTAY